MVLRLKPMGKPSTKKKSYKFWDRTKALHSPRTQAHGETKYLKKIYVTRTLESIRGELPINSWVNLYTERIPQFTLGSSVPKGLMQHKAVCYQKHD